MATDTDLQADIVIVGGGAGGLELAARLGRRMGRRQGRKSVLLIDRAPLHIWKPTLHEVAAGTLDAMAEGLSYPILARRNHFSFVPGELIALDPEARHLRLAEICDDAGRPLVPERQVAFRRLVLALGSGSNFFGTPGAEHAHVLEHADDAERFRQRLLGCFTRAAFSAERRMAVAIVGAGATGVELSAELLEAHDEMLESLVPDRRFEMQVTLLESSSRVLSNLPERISRHAAESLRRRKVDVRTDTKVVALRPDAVETEGGCIPADLILWAAGIQAAPANDRHGLTVNRAHQFVVDDRLRTSAQGIYALGDCAACPWRDGRIVPARAQAANQQAAYLAKVLAAPEGAPAPPPFRYRDFGSLVSLGEGQGVGTLMGSLSGPNLFVEGLVAKAVYMSLHLRHHAVVLGLRGTAVLALARLLQRRVSGRVKLH